MSVPAPRSARARLLASCVGPFGGAAALALLLGQTPAAAQALPSGGDVVSGAAQISAAAQTLTVTQTSARTAINWNSFNIGPGATVVFNQPGASAIALNRVVGADPSVIQGALRANGQVFLLNPNGLLFTSSARVNVGSLLASTGAISDADFAAGAFRIIGAGGEVANQGALTAEGGSIVLAAGRVSNSGRILADEGAATLAAGERFSVTLDPSGLFSVRIDHAGLDAQVRNSGLVQADGGRVVLTARGRDRLLDSVVRNDGLVRAQGLSQDGGVVILDGGDGAVRQDGRIDAASGSATGGDVRIVGDSIALGAEARIDVSGRTGGGAIRIGGDAYGAGPLPNARSTSVAAGAELKADALETGNGGQVIVWADDTARFDGTALARGGALGGDGGFVETSGAKVLSVGDGAVVNTLAPQGRAGSWLLDPLTINVATGGAATLAQAANTADVAGAITIAPATINGALSNVVLAAKTSITVTNAIAMTAAGVGISFSGAGTAAEIAAGPSAGTTLLAGITTNGGDITFAGPTILNANTTLAAGAGAVTFGGTVNSASATARTLTRTGSGATSFGAAVGGTFALSSLTTGAGTTTLAGDVTTTGVQTYGGALAFNGSTLTTTNSAISVAGATTLTQNATLAAGSGAVSFAGTLNGGVSLTRTGSGTNTFTGAVGGTTALTSLTTGTGTTTVAAGVTTAGAQSYGGALVLNASSLATTNANISIAGATTLGANATLNTGTGAVTFTGAVNGARTLDFTGTGALTFGSTVGNTSALTSLNSSGRNVTLTGNVTTTGAQTYGGSLTVNATSTLTTTSADIAIAGPTILNANTTLAAGAGAVTFGGTVNSASATARTLTRTGSGTTSFGATVGGTFALSALTTGAGTTILAGDVTTTGAQSYGGALTLNGSALTTTNNNVSVAGATTLTQNTTVAAGSGIVTFTGAVNGPVSLIRTGSGATVLTGAVGGTTALTSVTTGTGTTTVAAGVTTAGAQSYGGALVLNASSLATTNANISIAGATTLGANATLNTGTGAVTFTGAVNGARTLDFTGTGAVTFGSTVGNTSALTSLNSSGRNVTLTGNVTTTGAQTYGGSLTVNATSALTTTSADIAIAGPTILNANTTLAAGAGAVTFGGTVNSASATARTLTRTGSGATSFGAAVGGTFALSSLTTGAGTTTLAGDVTTTGVQTYGGALAFNGSTLTTTNSAISVAGATTLTQNATLAAGSGAVSFAGTLNGGVSLTRTGSGTNTFTGAVGGTTALTSLTTGTGTTTVVAGVTTTGAQSFGGALVLNASSLTTTGNGAITVTGATTLGANATLNTGTGAVTFTGAVNGARTLDFTGTGALTFGSTVGNTSALTSLNSSGRNVTLTGNVTTTGAQTYGGSLTVNATSVLTTTNANVSVSGPTVLNGAATIAAGTGAVTLSGTVNGPQSLTRTGAGATSFDAVVGGTTALAGLTTGAGAITLAGNVTTTGAQSYGGALTFNGSALSTTNAAVTVTGATTLTQNTTVAAGSGVVTFTGAVNGPVSLTRTGSGATVLTGAVGGTTALTSLTTGSGAATVTAGVTTTGAQSYGGALVLNASALTTTNANISVTGATTLGANATLNTGTGAVTFTGAVNGARTLDFTGTGALTFGSTVGTSTPLVSLNTGGRNVTLSGNVVTAGNQTYGGNLTVSGASILTTTNSAVSIAGTTSLGANFAISAGTGTVTFSGAVDGAQSLLRSGAGSTIFSAAVGAVTPLASLNSGGSTTLTANVTTIGAQSYGGALALNASALTTTNANILIGAATTLGADVTFNTGTGAVNFNNTVNGARSLTFTGTGTINFANSVGQTTPLTTINTGTRNIAVNGAVTTTGAQTYGGNLAVNSASTLTTSNASISIAGASTLNADAVLNAGSGAITFGGAINDAVAGAHSLTTTSSTSTTFNGAIGAATNLQRLVLGGQNTFAAGLTIAAPITLASNATFSAAGPVTFSGAINATTAGGQSLTLGGASGGTAFTGAIGAATPLSTLTLSPSGGTLTVSAGASTTGAQTFEAAAGVRLGGAFAISGPGAFTVTGPLTLLANTTITTTGSNASFASTIDSDSLATPRNLSVTTGAGAQTYAGALGGTARLGILTLASSSASGLTLASPSNSLTAANLSSGGAVTLANSGALTLTGVSAAGDVLVSTQAGNLTVTGAVSTTATSATALTLQAGRSANRVATPDLSDTNGDIVVSGGSFAVGAGGTGRLFTGSLTGSTGVAAAAGVGNSRYWSDTNGNTGFTTALGAGLRAIYREQPVLTVAATALGSGRTYDGTITTPTLSLTGLVNGDTGAASGTIVITGPGSVLKNAGDYVLNVSGGGGGAALDGLGYATRTAAPGTYTIVKATLGLSGLTVANKVYDATTTATVVNPGTLTGLVGGETLTINVGAAAFANKNVGTGKTVTLSSYTLTDGTGLASNYTLSGGAPVATADITPATISAVGGITVASRAYDGGVSATLNTGGATFAGRLGADVLTVGSASGVFADKNAGTGKAVNITGITLGGADAGNYALASTSATASGVITPAMLTLTGVSVADKVYDATTAATLSGVAGLSGLVGGETLTLSGGTAVFADKNAGLGKTVNIVGVTLGDGTGLARNYELSASGLTATASIFAASIASVSGITAANKVYDATTAASLDTRGAVFSGRLGSDVLTVSSAIANFGDKNVGTGKSVAISGIVLGGADAGNYTLANTTASASASISPATISAIGGLVAADKVYDATTNATLNTGGVTFAGRMGADVLTVGAGSALFADKNVGTGKTVTVTGLTLGGADAGNYVLAASTASLTAAITPAPLSVTGLVANSRIYDATTAATLNVSGASFTGRLGADDIALTGASGQFSDKNVGVGKTVTVTGLTLSGADARNYALGPGAVVARGDITPATISGVTISAAGKVYDGTTSATLNLASAGFAGRLGADVLTVSAATGAFTDRNAGTGKTVNISGITLGGADAGNYILASSVATTLADIRQAAVTLSGVTAASKVYDATTAAVLDLSAARLSGAVGGDVVTLGSATGAFADKNVGAGKAVVIAGVTLGGADAANYTVDSSTVVTRADITPAVISGIGGLAAATRVYDGTANATLVSSGATFGGRLGADQLAVAGGVAVFADANAGTGKAVSVSGLSLGGADARNYVLANTNASAIGTITPAQLTVVGLAAADKVYDATTVATLTRQGTLTGLVGGETLAFAITSAAFADKNAGVGKPVSITGFTLGNGTGLASNYQLNIAGSTAIATISPATIARITGITVRSKVFDGDVTADLDTAGAIFVGRLGADVLAVGSATGVFSDPELGLGKTVQISGLSLAGADAGNYRLADTTTQASGDIAQPTTGNLINAVNGVGVGPFATVGSVPILATGGRLNLLLGGPARGEPQSEDSPAAQDPAADRPDRDGRCAAGFRRDGSGECRPI